MDEELDTSVDSSSFDDSGSDFADTSDYSDSTDVESIMDDIPVESTDDFSDTEINTDLFDFDDSGSDFADTSDYSDSTDVESIMDDIPVESTDDSPDTEMNTDFPEDISENENVSELTENSAEYEPNENSDVDSTGIVDADEISDDSEEIESVDESDIEALMDDENEAAPDILFDEEDLSVDTDTDLYRDTPSTEEEDRQPEIDELMNENADEQVENIESASNDEISETSFNDTSDLPIDTGDTDDEVAADIVDIMDEAALEELNENSSDTEESINVEDLMENGTENDEVDTIETSEIDVEDIANENIEEDNAIDEQSLIMEDGDNLISDTDNQIDDSAETDESQKVLKRDEFELLAQGNSNINDLLDVKADDYRDKGFSEEEIANKLENDKIELQQEFLKDAFPNQDVSPAVFNGFEDTAVKEPSIDNNSDTVFDGDTTDDTTYILDINDGTNIQSNTDTLDTAEIQDHMTQDVADNEDTYTSTPISDVQIVQEDGSVDTIENIMSNLDAEPDSGETTYDIPINEPHYTAPVDETSTIQNGDLADVDEGISSETENDIDNELSELEPIEKIDDWIKDVNPNFDEFDIDSPYCNNCGSCAYAVYQRLEGNPNIAATAENIGYNSEMEALTGMEQVSMSPQDIEQRLLDEGNGAHAIIGIDRAEGAGHWFNAACIDGKVVAIDGQDGSISGWPPDYGDVVNWEMSIRKETNNG